MLEEQDIMLELEKLPNWTQDGKFISRRYRFASFRDAVSFVNKVAEIAEERDHHPFISIDFKMVTLRLTSWHAGGLTHADFSEANAFDAVYVNED